MKRIHVLDSLRGMAAAIVVFHHVFTRFTSLFTAWERHCLWIATFISDLSTTAVLFFFFLSGFSICLSLKNSGKFDREKLNTYLYRRFKRILPLYFFALLFIFLAGLITHQLQETGFQIHQLLGNIFFLQCSPSFRGNWFVPYGGNGPLWSLSFEMFYYLFFPVLMILLGKLIGQKIYHNKWQGGVLLISFLLSVTAILINANVFIPYIAFLTLFYVWYAGYFLCSLYLSKSLSDFRILLIPFVLYIGLMLVNQYFHSANFQKLQTGTGIFFFLLIFYYCRNYLPGLFSKFENLVNFIFLSIGKGSYAIYLLHYPLLLILQYYQLNNAYLILPVLFFFTLGCIVLEQFTIRQKWVFLKRSYCKISFL